MKRYILLIIVVCVAGVITARRGWCLCVSKDTSKVLKAGDPVPGDVNPHVVNYSSDVVRLTDFKDKLLILDFWASYCSPCLRSLPKFQHLQDKFAGKVQFLLVTSDKPEVALKVLRSHQITLPSITASTLYKRFNVNYIPHEVWIKNGVVLAETQPWIVTEANIAKLLSGESVTLPSKVATYQFDDDKPFLVNGNGGTGENLLQHSVLTGYISGYPSKRIKMRDASHRVNRVTLINAGIPVLFQVAMEMTDPAFAHNNRLVIDVSDSLKPYFFKPDTTDDLEQMSNYGFCYEIIAPPENLPAKMLNDLNGYFSRTLGIRGEIQKRIIPCWVISKLPVGTVYSKGGPSDYKSDSSGYKLSNLPYKQFFNDMLTVHSLTTPVVDSAFVTGNINLKIDGTLNDFAAVRRGLNKIGLEVSKRQCTAPMLVITNKPKSQENLKPESK